jgi:ribosome-binding factor A
LLRRELARRLRTRTVPKLEFRYDEVVEHGARLSALIDAAVADDAERHRDDAPPPDDASPEDAA